jgi:hypothetical protein
MSNNDNCGRNVWNNRFQIIQNKVRGHCFKYLKEISKRKRENFFSNLIKNVRKTFLSEMAEIPTVNSFKADIDHRMSSNRLN